MPNVNTVNFEAAEIAPISEVPKQQPPPPLPPLPPATGVGFNDWNSAGDVPAGVWRDKPGTIQDLDTTAHKRPSVSEGGSQDGGDEVAAKKKRIERFANGKDYYCWCCHKEKANVFCNKCPRSYHFKCLSANNMLVDKKLTSKDLDVKTYVCFNCVGEKKSEEKPSVALRNLSPEEFNDLLLYALNSIKMVSYFSKTDDMKSNNLCIAFRRQTPLSMSQLLALL